MENGIGQKVRARMEEMHLNSAELARKAGLERTFVHDLVTNRKKTVTADALVALAVALQCAPEDLVGRAGSVARGLSELTIEALIEPGVWRSGEASPPLGSIKLAADIARDASAFLMRTEAAQRFGIANGSVLIVSKRQVPKAGDFVIVERRRAELTELSVRKFAPEDEQTRLEAPSGLDTDAVYIPSAREGETVRIKGVVMRSILLFAEAVS